MDTQSIRPLISQHLLWAEKTKKQLSPLFWPQGILIQIQKTATALATLINPAQTLILDGLNILNMALGGVGWALHGIRFLINIGRLLTEYFLIEKSTVHKKTSYENKRICLEIGNDLLWVMKTFLPSNSLFNACLLVVTDILWENHCQSVEYDGLKISLREPHQNLNKRGFATQDTLTAWHEYSRKLLAHTRRKAILSAITIACASLLFTFKNIIIPL